MKKKKIGRNDPCPCGSGKKYKKCCLGKPLPPYSSDYILSKVLETNQKPVDELIKNIKQLSSTVSPKKKPKRGRQHYVPIWYQKGFIPDGHSFLNYLNLKPFKMLPNGREVKQRERYVWGPGNCFHKKDLYTTNFFGIRNDEIEEYLFGKIDNDGRPAIHSLLDQDFRLLSKYFTEIFIYMDAQKLRTPKGLDWIRKNYFQLTRSELLLEMQFLRTMHCTMWVEGVMEIVSAEKSDIKFIISDHPITIYNLACDPNTKICHYPDDPPTTWKASQTIFPLDLNQCLILTNLEYARDPDGVDPLISRTNPRYFAQTLARWDSIIRDRFLAPEEVSIINYIQKKRARRYIAAFELEWLYPEKTIPQDQWKSLSSVLVPPKNKIFMFGGEVYVGGNDGKLAWYQDEFGRRYTSRENADDPIREMPIKKKNQILFNAITEIFGFSKGKNWDDFRRELKDEQIKELYQVVGSLWNPDTEIMRLLPKPGDGLNAFFNGILDPRVIPFTIIGYSLYVDKIIMISPFPNPRVMSEEYSPFESPAQYRNDTIKNIFTMMQIMPLIDAGIVEMIPDPSDFDLFFKNRVYRMAKARMKYRKVQKEDMGLSEKLMRDDFSKFIYSLPSKNIKQLIKKAMPNSSEEDIIKAIEYIQKIKIEDPLFPLQQQILNKNNTQLQIFRMSGNFELAMYLAQVTGSFIYTDGPFNWKEYQAAVLKKPDEGDLDPWDPVAKAFNGINLITYSVFNPEFWFWIKEKGILKDLADLFQRLCISVRNIKDPNEVSVEAQELRSQIKQINMESKWELIEKEFKKNSKGQTEQDMNPKMEIPIRCLIPKYGLSSNTITQILLTHGANATYWESVPFAFYMDLQNMRPIQ